MKWMFAMCCADVDLSGFDVSKVTNMEGMFMAYGTSANEFIQVGKNLLRTIIQMIRSYLPFLPSKVVYDSLASGNLDYLIDAATTYSVNNFKSELDSGFNELDNLTSDYKNLVKLSSSIVQTCDLSNEYYDNGVDYLALDSSAADSINTDLSSAAFLSSQTYKDTLLSDFDLTSQSYVEQIKDIASEAVEDSGFNEFMDKVKQSTSVELNDESEPNIKSAPFKLTLPTTGFKPASDASFGGNKRCSMKWMFALYNIANTNFKAGDKVANYLVDLSKIDTEFVCDMAFMFSGYFFYPEAESSGQDKYQVGLIDVSGFNTNNIGPYDPTVNEATQPIGSMNFMFAVTGTMTKVSDTEDSDSQYNTEIKFGQNFVINDSCDTKLMFMYARAKKVDMSMVNVAAAKSFAGMFTFANILDLNLSS